MQTVFPLQPNPISLHLARLPKESRDQLFRSFWVPVYPGILNPSPSHPSSPQLHRLQGPCTDPAAWFTQLQLPAKSLVVSHTPIRLQEATSLFSSSKGVTRVPSLALYKLSDYLECFCLDCLHAPHSFIVVTFPSLSAAASPT